MAWIKQYRSHMVRVADPLRPGKRTFEERLIPTGASSVSHQGRTFDSDEDGWFDLLDELAATLLAVRSPGGERWFTPADIGEQVRLGLADDGSSEPKPAVKGSRPAMKRA